MGDILIGSQKCQYTVIFRGPGKVSMLLYNKPRLYLTASVDFWRNSTFLVHWPTVGQKLMSSEDNLKSENEHGLEIKMKSLKTTSQIKIAFQED